MPTPPFVAAQKVRVSQLNALSNVAGINTVSGANDTTTSGSYANLAATSSFSFTKIRGNGSGIKIEMHITCLSTATGTVGKFGVNINGVDYDVCQITFDAANTQVQASGVVVAAPNLAAGTYTVQGRWKRTTGAGTMTRNITTHWLSIAAMEVAV